jgi:hypothetical protein
MMGILKAVFSFINYTKRCFLVVLQEWASSLQMKLVLLTAGHFFPSSQIHILPYAPL